MHGILLTENISPRTRDGQLQSPPVATYIDLRSTALYDHAANPLPATMPELPLRDLHDLLLTTSISTPVMYPPRLTSSPSFVRCGKSSRAVHTSCYYCRNRIIRLH